jgi:dimethylaniline monooxygenase (N-oxide forming)
MFINTVIVGGGISGIMTLKHLKQENIEAIVLEKSNETLGVWNIKNDPSVFEDTYTVSSKLYMTISDFPLPKDYPEFPHWSLIYKYYLSYISHFNLNKYIFTNQKVNRVKKIGDKWKITVQNNMGSIYTIDCYHVVIASGSNNECLNYPDDEKFKNFTGEKYHCNNYKKIKENIKDKKVLIIGGSDSAGDTAVNLAQHQPVHMSIRNGQWFQHRYLGANEPADIFYSRVLDKFVKKIVGKKYIDKRFGKDFISFAWGEGGSGLKEWKPKCNYLNSYYNKSRDVIDDINKGKIYPHGRVNKVKDKYVQFNESEKWYYFDTMLFCTGYKALGCFKFLDENIVRTPRYKLIVYPNDPTIFFVGFIRPYLTSIPMLVEMQSRYVAKLCANKLKLPDMNKLVKITNSDIKKQLKEFPCNSKRMPFLVDPYDYCNQIAKLIGAYPNTSKYFFKDNKFWNKLMYGSWNHHVYRLNDKNPENVKNAMENINNISQNNTSKRIETKIRSYVIRYSINIIIIIIILTLTSIYLPKIIRNRR